MNKNTVLQIQITIKKIVFFALRNFFRVLHKNDFHMGHAKHLLNCHFFFFNLTGLGMFSFFKYNYRTHDPVSKRKKQNMSSHPSRHAIK